MSAFLHCLGEQLVGFLRAGGGRQEVTSFEINWRNGLFWNEELEINVPGFFGGKPLEFLIRNDHILVFLDLVTSNNFIGIQITFRFL